MPSSGFCRHCMQVMLRHNQINYPDTGNKNFFNYRKKREGENREKKGKRKRRECFGEKERRKHNEKARSFPPTSDHQMEEERAEPERGSQVLCSVALP